LLANESDPDHDSPITQLQGFYCGQRKYGKSPSIEMAPGQFVVNPMDCSTVGRGGVILRRYWHLAICDAD
jgi:hypothetical protein